MSDELKAIQQDLQRIVEIAQESPWTPQGGKGAGAQGTPEQLAKLHVLSKLIRIRRLTQNDYVRIDDDVTEIMLQTGEVIKRVSRGRANVSEVELDEDAQACGFVYDHDAETTYEDDGVVMWRCNRCGAEGWEDK